MSKPVHASPPPVSITARITQARMQLTPSHQQIADYVLKHPLQAATMPIDELAAAVNISRVSCRKYLIWLAQINILYTTIHYGATGRPVYRYRLVAEQYSLLKQYSQ